VCKAKLKFDREESNKTSMDLKPFVILGAVYLSGKIDMELYEMELVYCFFAVQAASLILHGLSYLNMSKSPASGNEKVKLKTGEEVTIQEHDMKAWKQSVQSTVMTIIIVSALYFKMEVARPLVIQSAAGLYGLFTNDVVSAFVFGQQQKRPWKCLDPPFAGLQAPTPEAQEEEKSKKESKKEK